MARHLLKSTIFFLLSQLLGLQAGLAAEADNPVTELEDKLLQATQVSLAFEITATGAVAANVQGTLALRGKDGVDFAVTGSFAGADVDLIMHSSAAELVYGAKDSPKTIDRPAALRESIIIGLTRMGILHNIARLSAGAPPDHGDGGVRDWVTVESVYRSADARRLTFDILVDGQPSGSAALGLDPFGMVVKREQTVEFPQGTMVVVENYSDQKVSGIYQDPPPR